MCRACETSNVPCAVSYRPPWWLLVAAAVGWWLVIEALFG